MKVTMRFLFADDGFGRCVFEHRLSKRKFCIQEIERKEGKRIYEIFAFSQEPEYQVEVNDNLIWEEPEEDQSLLVHDVKEFLKAKWKTVPFGWKEEKSKAIESNLPTNLLDQITMEELIVTCKCNLSTLNEETISQQFLEIFDQRKEEMLHVWEVYKSEIIKKVKGA